MTSSSADSWKLLYTSQHSAKVCMSAWLPFARSQHANVGACVNGYLSNREHFRNDPSAQTTFTSRPGDRGRVRPNAGGSWQQGLEPVRRGRRGGWCSGRRRAERGFHCSSQHPAPTAESAGAAGAHVSRGPLTSDAQLRPRPTACLLLWLADTAYRVGQKFWTFFLYARKRAV